MCRNFASPLQDTTSLPSKHNLHQNATPITHHNPVNERQYMPLQATTHKQVCVNWFKSQFMQNKLRVINYISSHPTRPLLAIYMPTHANYMPNMPFTLMQIHHLSGPCILGSSFRLISPFIHHTFLTLTPSHLACSPQTRQTHPMKIIQTKYLEHSCLNHIWTFVHTGNTITPIDSGVRRNAVEYWEISLFLCNCTFCTFFSSQLAPTNHPCLVLKGHNIHEKCRDDILTSHLKIV